MHIVHMIMGWTGLAMLASVFLVSPVIASPAPSVPVTEEECELLAWVRVAVGDSFDAQFQGPIIVKGWTDSATACTYDAVYAVTDVGTNLTGWVTYTFVAAAYADMGSP